MIHSLLFLVKNLHKKANNKTQYNATNTISPVEQNFSISH